MFAAWIRWLSSLSPSELLLLLSPLLFFDGLRYTGAALVCWLTDLLRDFLSPPETSPETYPYCPSVCVVLAGLNEADSIADTLHSVWGSYPRMELIVVDDGSTDGMADIADAFAAEHSGVLVLRKPERGGKSSALNFALRYTSADILVCVDTDSLLGPNAIWEIVQPLADERIAASSGAVILRNGFTNLCTRLQGFEYLRNIFLGRMFAARMGVMGIVSGAFGAFRRSALERLGGWDVGPGEDGDLVLRLRKQGFQIAFNMYAQCYTNAPTNFRWLFKQRRRWEWAAVTFECRKHVDLANPFGAAFTWCNFALLLERWLYAIVLPYASVIYGLWFCWTRFDQLAFILPLHFLAYIALESIQLLLILYYSRDRRRDLRFGAVVPLLPFYALFLRAATLTAITEEFFTRRSFRDNFVPQRVREATWHW